MLFVGLDYKELVHGANPLDAVKKVLVEANVHVLSKLVPKINSGLGGQITSGEIFAAYTTKIFWEDEQKKEESKVNRSALWRNPVLLISPKQC